MENTIHFLMLGNETSGDLDPPDGNHGTGIRGTAARRTGTGNRSGSGIVVETPALVQAARQPGESFRTDHPARPFFRWTENHLAAAGQAAGRVHLGLERKKALFIPYSPLDTCPLRLGWLDRPIFQFYTQPKPVDAGHTDNCWLPDMQRPLQRDCFG